MAVTLSKDKIKKILENADSTEERIALLKGLRQQGFVLEGFGGEEPQKPTVTQQAPETRRGVVTPASAATEESQPQRSAEDGMGISGGFKKAVSLGTDLLSAAARPFGFVSKAGEKLVSAGTKSLQEKPEESFVVKIAETFAPIGETLGETASLFGAGGALQMEEESMARQQKLNAVIERKIKETKDPVKKEKLLKLLNEQETPNIVFGSGIKSLEKSNLQIVGEGITTASSMLMGGNPNLKVLSSTQKAATLINAQRAARVALGAGRSGVAGFGASLQDEGKIKEAAKQAGKSAAVGALFSAGFEITDWGFGKLHAWAQGRTGQVLTREIRPPKKQVASDLKYHKPLIGEKMNKYGYKGGLKKMQTHAETSLKTREARLKKVLGQLSGDDLDFVAFARKKIKPLGPGDVSPKQAKDVITAVADKMDEAYGAGAGAFMRALDATDQTADDILNHAMSSLRNANPTHSVLTRDQMLKPVSDMLDDPLLAPESKKMIEDFLVNPVVKIKGEKSILIPEFVSLKEANKIKRSLYSAIPSKYWTDGLPADAALKSDIQYYVSLNTKALIEDQSKILNPSLAGTIKEINDEIGVALDVINFSSATQAGELVNRNFTVMQGVRDLLSKVVQLNTASRVGIARGLENLSQSGNGAAKTILETPFLLNIFYQYVGDLTGREL